MEYAQTNIHEEPKNSTRESYRYRDTHTEIDTQESYKKKIPWKLAVIICVQRKWKVETKLNKLNKQKLTMI